MTLPTNIDSTYPDNPSDTSVELHQQHHDALHAAVNGLPGTYLTQTAANAAYVASATTKAAATDTVATAQVTGDANPRFKVTADGKLAWGDGTAALDAILYRGVEDSVVELFSSKPFVPYSYVKVYGDPGNNTAAFEANANAGGFSRLALLESGVGGVIVDKPAGSDRLNFFNSSDLTTRVRIGLGSDEVRLTVTGSAGQTANVAEFLTNAAGKSYVDSAGCFNVDDGAGTRYRLVASGGSLFFQHSTILNFTDINSGTVRFAIDANGIPHWALAASAQTTVGAAGGASALPATPTKYLKVIDSAGTTLVIPAYASV